MAACGSAAAAKMLTCQYCGTEMALPCGCGENLAERIQKLRRVADAAKDCDTIRWRHGKVRVEKDENVLDGFLKRLRHNMP